MRIIRVSAAAAAAPPRAHSRPHAAAVHRSGGSRLERLTPRQQRLTYWASNQGASLQTDYSVLNPELAKFKQQTGITVQLQVIGWADLLNRILAATTSGQGPDVVNIGNTWSASLQATGAFLPFNGSTFARSAGRASSSPRPLGSTGAASKPPAAVPIYSLAYGLYYNKALFQAAGIASPPTTWDELVADGKKLTHGGNYGLAVEGAEHPGKHPQRLRPVQAEGRQLLRHVRQPDLHDSRERGGRAAVG